MGRFTNNLLSSSGWMMTLCWGFALYNHVSAFSPSQNGGWTRNTNKPTILLPQSRPSKFDLKEQGDKGGFSLGSFFGGNKEDSDAAGGTSTLRGSKLAPHPSVRKHISPLNRLGPDPQIQPKSEPLPIHPDVRSGTLSNGLPYIILPNKSPPGRFEAHLQVFSGSGE